jgi:hypothetical protein
MQYALLNNFNIKSKSSFAISLLRKQRCQFKLSSVKYLKQLKLDSSRSQCSRLNNCRPTLESFADIPYEKGFRCKTPIFRSAHHRQGRSRSGILKSEREENSANQKQVTFLVLANQNPVTPTGLANQKQVSPFVLTNQSAYPPQTRSAVANDILALLLSKIRQEYIPIYHYLAPDVQAPVILVYEIKALKESSRNLCSACKYLIHLQSKIFVNWQQIFLKEGNQNCGGFDLIIIKFRATRSECVDQINNCHKCYYVTYQSDYPESADYRGIKSEIYCGRRTTRRGRSRFSRKSGYTKSPAIVTHQY